ncbi:MAG: redoxin domain-containing protein [Verrucomicrobiota bacterium]
MKRRTYLTLLLGFVFLTPARSEEDPALGHSYHGEIFNEGPRQAAVLIPGTGDILFPVTTDSSEAQKFFTQGIGQIHGFWDFEAERSFRQVAAIDPECAMAYWGMAMANFKNDTRGKGFIDEAIERREGASRREQAWIDALADYFADTEIDAKKRLRELVRSFEGIATEYPNDVEAKAFLLKQIYYNHGKGLAIPSHFAINLLAEQILSADPDHPAHHYQIHLWDKEEPAKALEAAALCGPSAPAIAHMWHMPGHIYSRLHRYEEAVWQQEASARIDHAHMIRFRIMPDRIHNFAHNNEWLVRNLNYLGQLQRSIDLAENMISLPRLPKFKKEGDPETYDPKGSSWQYGRQRLRDTLVRFEQWERLVFESENGLLQTDEKSILQKDHDRFVGIAKFEIGDRAGGRKHLEALQTLLTKEKDEQGEAIAKAEQQARDAGKEEEKITEAKEAAAKEFKKEIESYTNLVNELSVYEALAFDPPNLKEARKLLPDLKNLAKSRHAQLWLRAGDAEKAAELAQGAVEAGEGEVLPLAAQVEILFALGNEKETRGAFEELRLLAHSADLRAPALQRLEPVAKALGYADPWMLAPEPSSDLGERPDLDSLGPFRWSPPSAPEFTLPDEEGTLHSRTDFKGPLLVLFFLGKECSHCMDQLNAFAPEAEAFRNLGIEIVAVSTDSVEGLRETVDTDSLPFPFPLLADPSLDRFRAYRAYDDFEDMPLHGTFFLDETGDIRWQEISYEPFLHPEWLLQECRRLLSFNTD